MNTHITGTGRFLPPQVLTNDDLTRIVDTSDEWIISRTGIRERHIAREMTTLDMAEQASLMALADAGLKTADIDLIIVATVTPDRALPSLACDLQCRMGFENAFCFDLGAACSGFIYAVDVASRYLATGGAQHALIVSSEKLSQITDYTDRTTCVLFGDGAGAAVLSASEKPGGQLGSYLAARGDNGAALNCDVGGLVKMDGHEVYRFAVRAMPDAIDQVLKRTGHKAQDLTYVIPHQANIRIIRSVMQRHDISPEKVVISLDRYGNTSSSTIPIALDELARDGKVKKGDLIMMVGFGAGLTYGATLYEWSK